MQINFIDQVTGDKYTIGRVSFNLLDCASIFDEYQEDNDPNSEIILLTNKDKVKSLSVKIIETITPILDLRDDIREKIIGLAEFICNSNGIKVLID